MHIVWRLIIALSVSLALMGCSVLGDPPDDNRNTLIYGLTLSPSGIDPHINRSTELGIVLRQVYDTLVYRHPDTRAFVPGLAERWEISDDGLIYTFYLRENVIFHDSTRFNAAAVVYNLDRIRAPETASQRARFLIEPIVTYEALDEYTVQMTLSQPFEPLLDAFSQVYLAMASPTQLAKYNTLRYQYYQVGTGPFEFVEYVPEDRIIIRRNPDYDWHPEFYGDLPPNAIDEVEFRFFRDAATRLIALESGDAHVMGDLLPTDARSVVNDPDIELLTVPIPGQPLQFYFNTQQAPTDQLAVRQALAYAANRTAIVDAVFGGFSQIAWGPTSSTTLFYNRGVQDVYAYNLQQAQQLLADVGYVDSDNDGIRDRDGANLTIQVLQPPWSSLPEVTQLLQDQWESIGIDVVVNPVSGYPALIEASEAGEYNLISFDQPGIDPYILNQSYLSDAQDNWTGYQNPELDSVLIEAMQTSDPEARRLQYGRAQAIILEQALVLPVREYTNLNAYVTDVQNLRYDPYGWFPLLYPVALANE
jgi:peptide/nickel transport system substrate-binding protein